MVTAQITSWLGLVMSNRVPESACSSKGSRNCSSAVRRLTFIIASALKQWSHVHTELMNFLDMSIASYR